MALLFNNNTPVHILYNNQNVSKVVYNGHDVWYAYILKTITGVPPLTIPDSSSDSLYDYKIYGNLLRDGTPSIDNPVDIQTVGDLVTDPLDEHYGEYKIPVTIAKLPAEYQEVEYIESSGTQYLDTNFAPTNNTRVETKFYNNSIRPWYIFGSRSSQAGIVLAQSGSITNATVYGVVNGTFSETGWTRTNSGTLYKTIINTKEGVFDYYIKDITNNKQFSQSGVSYTQISGTVPDIFIFALNAINVQENTTRMYYFKIYNNGTLVRDLVPCYRIADNEVGMYDVVNGVFYINKGEGTFAKGSNVQSTITYNIYLSEPLRKTTTSLTDYIDFQNKKCYRKVAEKVFKGTETWSKTAASSGINLYWRQNMGSGYRYNASSSAQQICNYVPFGQPSTGNAQIGASIYHSSGYSYFRIRFDGQPTTVEDMKAYVKNLYDNGNPLRIVYGLPSSLQSEEDIELPEILTNKGTNIISVGTSLQPSNMEVQYY